MTYIQTANDFVWLVLVAVVVLPATAAAAVVFSAVRQRRRRRRRQEHLRVALRQHGRSAGASAPLANSLTPTVVRAVRAHGERSAARHWHAGIRGREPVNPYASGTREHVIWYASFQLATHNLMEEQAADVVHVLR